MLLEVCETSSELSAGTLESCIRIKTIKPCCIDGCEKKISKLILRAVVCGSSFLFILSGTHCIKFRLILSKLLLDLLPHVFLLLPIEADSTGLVLHTVSLQKRRKSVRNARKHSLVAVLLSRLEHLPLLDDALGITYLSVREHMRMAIYQLVTEEVDNVHDVKILFLLSDLRIKDHMQKHISELLRKLTLLSLEDRVAEFIDLFNSLRTQRLVCLLPVPWTFLSQFIKHIQNPSERFQLFFSCMHNLYCFSCKDPSLRSG